MLTDSQNPKEVRGSVKGGVVAAIRRETGLPIRFVGMGETLNDLEAFDADEYASALLPG